MSSCYFGGVSRRTFLLGTAGVTALAQFPLSPLAQAMSEDRLLSAKPGNEILSSIPKCDVYLMPLGDTAEQINKNCEDVINMAIENGFKYCDRLHIRVWDNKRGV